MLNIDQLNGNLIKKKIGAERVIKQYENKHVDGSGNFGYFIRKDNTAYSIDGDYGRDGYIYNLRVGKTYGNAPHTPKESETIQLIRKALFEISQGDKSVVKNPKVSMTIDEVNKLERENVRLRNGFIPEGKIDLIHFYILEDANFHTLNRQLTKMGKFGAFETKRYPTATVYTPKAYGKPMIEARFKKYEELGGKTYEL